MENDFFKKKEELENKIKDINTYWKNLELTYQTEFPRLNRRMLLSYLALCWI